jgi:hypothetical protein
LCRVYVELMREDFPELRVVRGHYICPTWGKRAHWWLSTDQGDIVDPTAAQFPSHGCGDYEVWEEGAEEPTGKCMNCGEYCYGGKAVCSDTCATELMEAYPCT